MPRLSLVAGGGSGSFVRRTREHIAADGAGDVYLQIQVEGTAQICSPAASGSFPPAEGFCCRARSLPRSSIPGRCGISPSRRPGGVLRALAANPEAALMRPIPRDNQALRLLKGYLLGGRSRRSPAVRPGTRALELVSAFTVHVHSLMALAIGALREDLREAASLGVRAARLYEIKAYIARNLGRTALSVPEVAERHGVTPRYVQMLFAAEGVTFSEYVLGQRLAQARQMLTEPVFASRSISSIAFEAGFADLSHFNKAFRRRFGATPTDVRFAVGSVLAMK